MKTCAACGDQIGLWTMLTHSDSQVCKKCHEQGQSQLQILVNSVNGMQSFKKELAERWLNQFGDTVRKYRISEEGVGLRVQKTTHQYVGGHSSVSIPLGHGVRFKTGGFKGHREDRISWEDGGTGVLHITNQRVCFTGQQSVAIPYKKMISISG